MLDFDLAELYQVETKRLKEAVRRNIERFEGDDFMFVLSEKEYEILRTQIATSSLTSQNASSNWGGRRYIGKHGKIDPVGTDEIDPVKTA